MPRKPKPKPEQRRIYVAEHESWAPANAVDKAALVDGTLEIVRFDRHGTSENDAAGRKARGWEE